jgi:hypothetical protein
MGVNYPCFLIVLKERRRRTYYTLRGGGRSLCTHVGVNYVSNLSDRGILWVKMV